MAKVPNALEILPKIWTAVVERINVTDKQTTDVQATAYSEREREFAKNGQRELCTAVICISSPVKRGATTSSGWGHN